MMPSIIRFVLALVSVVSLCSATIQLSHMSTLYLPFRVTPEPRYGFDKSSVEQMSYHPGDKLVYAVGKGVLHVVNASDTSALSRVATMEQPDYDYTDVEVCGDHVFVTADNIADKLRGLLLVYAKYDSVTSNMTLLHSIEVGAVPDMVHPREDCHSALVAVEAEAFIDDSGKFNDPESAVAIVTFPEGVATKDVHHVELLNFRKFNDRVADLLPSGVRFVFRQNDNPFSADVEPEYVAIDEENDEAFVVLQENNAIAKVNLKTKNITAIHGLGFKQWGHIDTSDEDGGARISYWPLRAWYLPDSMHYHKWKGQRLLFTANEGDAKEYPDVGFNEEMRGHDVDGEDYVKEVNTQLSDKIHPIVKSALKDDSLLGRLTLSKYDGLDADGQYEALYAYGGRGLTIWDAHTLTSLWDSGSDVEDMTALHCPHLFNGVFDVSMETDVRSDNKGPESESLAVVEIGDRLYIFLGNERPGSIAIYSIGNDVTKPRFERMFCGGIPNSNKSVTELFDERVLYGVDPEDIKYYDGPNSPNGQPVVFVVGSASGTISILNVTTSTSSFGDAAQNDDDDDSNSQDFNCLQDDDNSGSHIVVSGAAVCLTVFSSALIQVLLTRPRL